MALKDQLKAAADAVRKAVDSAAAADDSLRSTVDQYVSLAKGIPLVGGYASSIQTIVDDQDNVVDAVKLLVDASVDEIDKLTS